MADPVVMGQVEPGVSPEPGLEPAPPAEGRVPAARRSPLVRRFRADPFFQLGLALVGLVLVAAVFAPWLAPHNPYAGDLQHDYLVRPGGRFLLGTDTQGRDVLSRVIYGARISVAVGLISQSVAALLGVTLGLLAGYYGKWVDALVMRLADVTLAFPTLLLLIAVAAAVKPSLPLIFVVIGIVGWAGMARLVRSQVLVLRRAEFVLAAQALGARDRRVLFRHLLPNVRAQVIIAATLGVAGAIMAEAALSFVGLGAQPPTPSWGAMVSDGRDLLRVAPWVSFAPGIAIGLAVLGFNLVGDALREIYDPRLRTER
ncbi:MAG TPA: ABC transporter permease [Gemmatimonadales bacterium]|nr:ABC transporter permease [Gemmatimonadales bacterium]